MISHVVYGCLCHGDKRICKGMCKYDLSSPLMLVTLVWPLRQTSVVIAYLTKATIRKFRHSEYHETGSATLYSVELQIQANKQILACGQTIRFLCGLSFV